MKNLNIKKFLIKIFRINKIRKQKIFSKLKKLKFYNH